VKFIYVRAEPAVSFERILQRGRPGEMIPMEYLQNCHKYHDEWLLLTSSPLLILNADADIKKDSETLAKWIRDISSFLN
jgi:deoxyadenosine/deoxycytidine kinase